MLQRRTPELLLMIGDWRSTICPYCCVLAERECLQVRARQDKGDRSSIKVRN
jgi:hypothetical protein